MLGSKESLNTSTVLKIEFAEIQCPSSQLVPNLFNKFHWHGTGAETSCAICRSENPRVLALQRSVDHLLQIHGKEGPEKQKTYLKPQSQLIHHDFRVLCRYLHVFQSSFVDIFIHPSALCIGWPLSAAWDYDATRRNPRTCGWRGKVPTQPPHNRKDCFIAKQSRDYNSANNYQQINSLYTYYMICNVQFISTHYLFCPVSNRFLLSNWQASAIFRRASWCFWSCASHAVCTRTICQCLGEPRSSCGDGGRTNRTWWSMLLKGWLGSLMTNGGYIFPIFSQPAPTRISLLQQKFIILIHLEIQNPSFFQAATSSFREDISYIP